MKSLILAILCCAFSFAATEKMNDINPEGKPVKLVFKEDLRIGPSVEDEDHNVWVGPNVFMEVDDKDNMYVLDPYASRILKYDGDGNFVGPIGRRGSGPGEFHHVVSFKLLPNGNMVLYDKPRSAIVFLDENGKFIRQLSDVMSGRYVHSATFSPLGDRIIGFTIKVEGSTGQMDVGTAIMGLNRYPEKQLFEMNAPPVDPSAGTNMNYWTDYLAAWFKLYGQGPTIGTFGPEGEIYTAATNEYKITRYSPELKEELTFGRKYKARFMSNETLMQYMELMLEEVQSAFYGFQREMMKPKMIERAIEKAELPPAKPPIYGMVPMEDGKLLVIHDYIADEKRPLADLFDKKGNYLGSSKLPKTAINIFAPYFSQPIKMIFKNGRAYTIELDEAEDLTLVRYNYDIK